MAIFILLYVPRINFNKMQVRRNEATYREISDSLLRKKLLQKYYSLRQENASPVNYAVLSVRYAVCLLVITVCVYLRVCLSSFLETSVSRQRRKTTQVEIKRNSSTVEASAFLFIIIVKVK